MAVVIDEERLSETFAALANSTRRAILARLAQGQANVNELAEPFDMTLTTPGGPMQMWFTGEYREVVPNERLVYTESVCDENGNVLTPSDVGMPGGHPATTTVTVELQEVGGRTNMVLTHAGVPADSPGAAGWAMALNKLAAHLEAHSIR